MLVLLAWYSAISLSTLALGLAWDLLRAVAGRPEFKPSKAPGRSSGPFAIGRGSPTILGVGAGHRPVKPCECRRTLTARSA